MRSKTLVCLCFVVLAMAARDVRAEDWQDVLKRPISPGSVILLVEHGDDAAVLERWREGLVHADPRVRAATARAVNVGRARDLGEALAVALEKETNLEAGIEEIRGVVSLGANLRDEAVLQVARRLDEAAVRVFADIMVRTRGPLAFGALDVPEAERDRLRRFATTPGLSEKPRGQSIRTIADLPSTVWSDVVGVTKCKTSDARNAIAATVEYDNAGRVRSVSALRWNSMASACVQAFRALFVAALQKGDSRRLPTETSPPELVVLATSRDVIACKDLGELDSVARGVPPVFPIPPSQSVRVSPPKKTRSAPPIYPASAQSLRIEGTVAVQLSVGTSGCVTFGRVLVNPDVDLSIAALEAVSQWKFEPVVLDGVPQTVLYNNIVTFQLR